eukprot:TRINITY_DN2933_c0_g1_i12.p1 TRINITY_DN2933_c0_g1~~TRINITY_DN2933_c0_g1_i12.p1  ORF type:complete len:105 (-),score=3.64 TRINITY_DN2933_c0_g1_i12:1110-1424(-)
MRKEAHNNWPGSASAPRRSHFPRPVLDLDVAGCRGDPHILGEEVHALCNIVLHSLSLWLLNSVDPEVPFTTELPLVVQAALQVAHLLGVLRQLSLEFLPLPLQF